MNEKRKVVELKNVVKQYKLYKNSKKRFIGIFFKRVKYRQKLAVNGVSFSIYELSLIHI